MKKSAPITLSGNSPAEHLVEFDHAPCQWRLQFWSEGAAVHRVDSDADRIRIRVVNLDDEPLDYHPQIGAPPLTVAPGESAVAFDDSVWELTMVNRSAEVEQAILSSADRAGSLKLVFEPDLGGGRSYQLAVSLRRAVNRG